MVQTSDFADFVLPSVKKMAVAITIPMNYHLETARGNVSLTRVLGSLIAAEIDGSH
jgi:hypothetical protein